MTVDEKRKAIIAHCENCEVCPLNIGGWKKPFAPPISDCLKVSVSDEDDLDRALKILRICEVENDSAMTEREAIAYIEKVLTWEKWKKHHTRLVQSLEIILSKIKQ